MSAIPSPTRPPVSVVMAVVDESRHVESAVRRILAQDYPGEVEVAVAVGPSRDDTRAIVERLAASDPRVVAVDNPTGRTAAGLNAAIAASQHAIVARVDGHSLLPPHYLRRAVELLEETGAANVGGMMAAEGVSDFELAVARAMTSWLGVGGARFHTGGERGFVDTVYLGVFRREVLQAAGGYDESFLRAQDWELNYRIRQAGGRILFDPGLRVTYRPRSTPAALARQYFHYGRWRRVVVRQHRGSVTPRYLAPPAALVAVGAGAALGLLGWRPAWLAPGGYAGAIVTGSVLVGRGLPLRARAALPVVFATMHGAWGAGFLTSPRSLRPTAEERLAEAAAETTTTPPSGPPPSV